MAMKRPIYTVIYCYTAIYTVNDHTYYPCSCTACIVLCMCVFFVFLYVICGRFLWFVYSMPVGVQTLEWRRRLVCQPARFGASECLEASMRKRVYPRYEPGKIPWRHHTSSAVRRDTAHSLRWRPENVSCTDCDWAYNLFNISIE